MWYMERLALPAWAGLSAVLVASCIGGPGNAGVAWLRNESGQTVSVVIEQPSHGGLSGIVGGIDRIKIDVPPWQDGWCDALGRGINGGSVTISVTGASVPFPISSTFNETGDPPRDVMVIVDATGQVRFTRDSPSGEQPCLGYPEAVPSAS
jgi:hypothetical protein